MYAELHAKSNFSFLEGASHPAELVEQAKASHYAALAVTDRNSLAGIVRAHGAAKDLGLRLIVGAEITPADTPPVVLWATDRRSYGRLARLITRGRLRAPKGECHLSFTDVAEHAEGLLAGVLESREQASVVLGAGPKRVPLRPAIYSPLSKLLDYRDLFGDRCYLLAELFRGPNDARELERLRDLSRRTRLPLVAAGNVHYHDERRAGLHDVLTAIRLGCTVAQAAPHLFANAQRHMKSPEEIATAFAAVPDALRRTVEIADRCHFSLDELRYEYPEELAPPGMTTGEYLAQLTWQGASQRYPRGVPDKVRGLIGHELALIADLQYEAYFLTVWDLVRFARGRGILCQGRGSAANSVVCYCLGITSVDPERMDVLFERFVSRERNEAPDIDVDFEHQRREEVLQYIYEKYGRERSGITAETITYRPRSAVRDVGKALGIPVAQLDALAKRLEHFHEEPDLARRCREAGIDPQSTVGQQLLQYAGELVGFPRHLSQHTGGMVITRGPLCELVPIENAAMPGRTVIEWNKDDLDELGILKVDCLALGMLSAIHRAFDFVEKHHDRRLTLANIPPEDDGVYEMIRRADTMGVFQIESRAQMSMLPRLQPRTFYDLVIEVAIVRPGPIQGDMVHPYLRRRAGEESVTYPNDLIRSVLTKTLGVPLFQEQAMRLAVVAAGFTPGEADQLRRAMGAWRRPGVIEQFRRRLIGGMRANGFSEEYAQAVFGQISGFGDYGFPESHAASFALLVYVSAWLKHHYPAAFTAALLNSQPMGFYAPAQLVRNAREHGVEVRPLDVNFSDYACTLEPRHASASDNPEYDNPEHDGAHWALRLGLNRILGMPIAQAEQIVAARGNSPFRTFEDLAQRAGLSRAMLSRLAKAGALRSLAADRRGALWHSLGQDQNPLPLFANNSAEASLSSDTVTERGAAHTTRLPRMTAAEEVLADYRTVGLSLGSHPLTFLRHELTAHGIVPAEALKTMPDGSPVAVAGIVLVRQRPSTAKGITFVTLEDETSTANLIIRQAVWNRYRDAAFMATLMVARGRLQRQGPVIHVLTTAMEDLSPALQQLTSQSRDFC